MKDFNVLSMRENKTKTDHVLDETKCKNNSPITVLIIYSFINNNTFFVNHHHGTVHVRFHRKLFLRTVNTIYLYIHSKQIKYKERCVT